MWYGLLNRIPRILKGCQSKSQPVVQLQEIN